MVVTDSQVNVLARVESGCTPTAVSTFTQGEFWQAYPDRTSNLSAAILPSDIHIPGIYAVAKKDSGVDIAVFGDTGCSGVRFKNLPTGSSSAGAADLGCLAAVTSPTALALAVSGGELWLWANNDLYTSADNAATWKKVERS
ncbi:hypothetical protein KPL76_05880 [Subtercola sp. PAMC28395]|uniref:hypothetical protein n=1 Tax=Subtercola sp. PAMC28395 TaxID=2846775 RepID=UPI001C0CDB4E|nr:hypothetical protein [Subtercola sp. PAMC28395]QWT24887.1 hypothetical protein KPL76_05880 [Subtercola sp. PAMC28395]